MRVATFVVEIEPSDEPYAVFDRLDSQVNDLGDILIHSVTDYTMDLPIQTQMGFSQEKALVRVVVYTPDTRQR